MSDIPYHILKILRDTSISNIKALCLDTTLSRYKRSAYINELLNLGGDTGNVDSSADFYEKAMLIGGADSSCNTEIFRRIYYNLLSAGCFDHNFDVTKKFIGTLGNQLKVCKDMSPKKPAVSSKKDSYFFLMCYFAVFALFWSFFHFHLSEHLPDLRAFILMGFISVFLLISAFLLKRSPKCKYTPYIFIVFVCVLAILYMNELIQKKVLVSCVALSFVVFYVSILFYIHLKIGKAKSEISRNKKHIADSASSNVSLISEIEELIENNCAESVYKIALKKYYSALSAEFNSLKNL